MQPVSSSFSFLRACLLAFALAAISILLARGDNPAAATTYNPQSSVSVSDPSPGANADLTVSFSLNAPDAFPNLTREPSIQFLPRQWGINAGNPDSAPIGSIAGTFNVLTNVGIMGAWRCFFPVPADFTMYDASVDTTRPSSALDVSDTHPGGLGYSGQFMPDMDTAQGPPSDFGTPLVPFVTLGNNQVGNEFHNGPTSAYSPGWGLKEAVYRDNDGSGTTAVDGSGVTVGDTRLTPINMAGFYYPAGSVVAPGDGEFIGPDWNRRFIPMRAVEKHTDPNGNGLMDPGEAVYYDYDNSGDVSYNDVRQFVFEGKAAGSTSVAPKSYLLGGISRYPDFLAQMFPPDVVGEPLARMWGGQTVVAAVVSVNLVTFRPGQLPGFPATMGYPTVTIVLDPVAAPDLAQNNMVNVTCTPLSLTSTNLALSKDNPKTPSDEGGYVRLANPMAEKDHTFTLVTTSDYDADNDGIENWLDTCDLVTNSPAGDDGRTLFGGPGDTEYDPDWGAITGDGLNQACDPDPNSFTQNWGAQGQKDQDLDSYNNVADNCPLTPNGYSGYTITSKTSPPFWFFWAVGIGPVGPDNQADADGDRIGDACEGSESGPQCANDVDDDADGVINDGCPTNGAAESPLLCTNATDDDGDGAVNDGCPSVGTRAETATATAIRVFLHPDTAIASSQYGGLNEFRPDTAFDGDTNTAWCTRDTDSAPFIEAQFASPHDINSLDITNPWYWQRFKTGRITMSNEFSQDITLNWKGEGSLTFPTQAGVTWVRFTGLTWAGWHGCIGEFNLNLSLVTTPAECGNNTDDDGDGVVNDGCPTVQNPAVPETQCANNTNDDPSDDSYINDGCPAVGEPEAGDQCANAADDDADGYLNDGCPVVGSIAETDGCANNLDDDGDGLVNDGCPAVDALGERFTPTGHKHVVSVVNAVTIFKHGVKLDDLDGPESVALDGSATYNLSVENKSDSAEDVSVALRVVEGCGTVSGPSTVHVNGDASANTSFTVDFSGCAGTYTVQADACHGDDADAGLFGEGACPGASDGKVDTNQLDDAPRSITVVVGSP